MLKNFWYAVEFGAALRDRPRRLRVLGQDIVVFRDERGQVAAMSDLCIHRGGSLGDGWVEHGCVRCPYHGWAFDRSGQCVKIPANRHDHIPKRARVDAYPAQERYGWVWVFLGDLPEAERPPILDVPEARDSTLACVTGEFTWNAHYARVVENGIDIAHTPFVHRGSFGNLEQPEIDDYEVVGDDYSGRATAVLMPPLPRGLWKLIRRQRSPVKATVSYHLPSFTRLELDLGAWRTIVYDSNVPVDEHTTRTLFLAYRNFFTGRWADRDARRRMFKIFREDQPTVEAQRPELLPYDLAAELHVKSDALGVSYRRARNRFLDLGWGVASRRGDERVAVIGSPLRRETDETEWVMPQVNKLEVVK